MSKEELFVEAGWRASRDRLELAITPCDRVESEADFQPISEDQAAELDRRLDAYFADPSAILSADQAVDELERELP
jgi:putative addiction module component (TIGR02574 family)